MYSDALAFFTVVAIIHKSVHIFSGAKIKGNSMLKTNKTMESLCLLTLYRKRGKGNKE
jgi:hypothetical protein